MQQFISSKKFLQQETRAFGNNIGKEPQKPRPNIFTENICSACNPVQVAVFLQTCNFVEKRLKSSHFKDSIIH